MLISCEKCATTYVLDEKLIPASGAAVQCTRCSHVFTAFPPRTDAQATVLEDEPTTSRRKTAVPGGAANQTMVFGAQSSPASKPANQTMVFGTQAPGAAPGPAPAANKAANQTMMFGAPATSAPAAPTPAPNRPANQTMVFGTPAGQQLASAPPPAQAPANQTLVFGAKPAAPAPNPANQTMMFGTPAGQQAAREPAPAPAPPPGVNQTMMFGTPAGPKSAPPVAPATSPANQTLVFGANPAAAPNPKATQVFGAPAVAPPVAQPRPASSTMVFGAQQPAGPAPAGPVPAPANRPANQTMMFGKPPELASAAATKTMAFGTPVAPARPPPVTQGTVELNGDAESEGPRESTVRVDLDAMMRAQEDQAGEESGESMEQRHDRTQRYAMTDSQGTPGEGAASVQDRHNRTALFAMSTLQETTKPDAMRPGGTAPELQGIIDGQAEPTVGFDGQSTTIPPDGSTTLPPNAASTRDLGFLSAPPTDTDPGTDPPGVSTLLEPGEGQSDMMATMRADGPIASTLPNLPPIGREATDAAARVPIRLDLISNSALPAVGGTMNEIIDRPIADVPAEAAAEQLAASGRRRNTIAIVVVLLLVLAAGAAVAWVLFGKELLAPGISPEARASVEQSVTKLRLDDPNTRQTEVARLESMVKEYPTFADAHAALVVALALEFDDLHAENAVIVARYKAIRADFDKLDDAGKTKPEGRAMATKVNALVEQQKGLAERDKSLREKVERAQKTMEAVAQQSGGASSDISLVRARAFHRAVYGVATDFEPSDDFWLKIVPATLVLNQEKQPKDQLEAALQSLRPLLDAEETASLPRLRFLEARLNLALGEREKTVEALDKALAASPNYPPAVTMKKLVSAWEKK
ncbi:MAG: zinc-ribbon domain-containing protein [Myxococcaceae bacterium]|nr:zinc-ribbon domain-containing protein [Myxococcaceae bacterium]